LIIVRVGLTRFTGETERSFRSKEVTFGGCSAARSLATSAPGDLHEGRRVEQLYRGGEGPWREPSGDQSAHPCSRTDHWQTLVPAARWSGSAHGGRPDALRLRAANPGPSPRGAARS